jgi:hypothetical protein
MHKTECAMRAMATKPLVTMLAKLAWRRSQAGHDVSFNKIAEEKIANEKKPSRVFHVRAAYSVFGQRRPRPECG